MKRKEMEMKTLMEVHLHSIQTNKGRKNCGYHRGSVLTVKMRDLNKLRATRSELKLFFKKYKVRGSANKIGP
ncbi:hypothetical protein QG37_01763 [Candidozyma auris]|uniref:Uncharacterized protein n=1 Tax=Candidozyma auris TaxID=498019 RepID=A0A0L0P3K5_CANAR|nr:hypothetical protein QG37_01763 [[Candida] auris]